VDRVRESGGGGDPGRDGGEGRAGDGADRLRIALVGYGRMGHAVESVALEEGHEIVARLDEGDAVDAGGLAGADVAIDFTLPEAAVDNVRAVAGAGVDLVVGTTGWYDRLDEARAAVDAAGTAMIWAPNFSLGVQLFFRAARSLARLADALDQYDVHVHEAHHRHKVDHPSGTARSLADILVEELSGKSAWAEGPPDGAPDPSTLQVTSSRAGEIPGTHVVGLEGPDDRLELRHEARGRTGFARGAVAAARWVRGRNGVYTLDDMLAERFGSRSDEHEPTT
jgi:4-hydroxy-tetrahydrodipicolinate reductase